MYGSESWTIKKAEHRRTDAFELWCWRWLLRIPWTERRSNQSILKEINPEYSLEGLTLKLMLRANSLEKTLMLGRINSRKRRGQQEDEMVGWHHRFNEHESEQTPGDYEGQESLVCYSPGGLLVSLSLNFSFWKTPQIYLQNSILFVTF